MLLETIAIQPTAATLPRSPGATVDFAVLRRTEYARLDEAAHAYLDYTGAGVYAASQIEAQHHRLMHDVLGNPHSENPAAVASTVRIDNARQRLLTFLHADPAEYDVVFTANASAALRLVAEGYPFGSDSHYVLTADNHNSVNGIRCHAERADARVCYVPLTADLRAQDPAPWLKRCTARSPSLFAYPAQSNFSGVRHPLEWIGVAQSRGYRVLLDAAAFAPTSELRLADVHPDFVCLSFYKMFGFPTGAGALVARRDALAVLRRPWFAGGTVDWVSTAHSEHALRADADAFADGTPHFLVAAAITDGLDLLTAIGMERINRHVSDMTAYLIARLTALRHSNGRTLIQFHGPRDMNCRGGTVAFTVRAADGNAVAFNDVVVRAGLHRVSVRGGCFCNPGCAETALEMDTERARVCRQKLRGRFDATRFAACMGGPVGAVRASTGIPTTTADIDRLADVLGEYRQRGA